MDLSLFPELNLLTVFILVLGGVLCFIGIRRLINRRYFSGSAVGLAGASLIAVSLLFALLITNLYSYQRLTYEAPVAKIKIRQTGEKKYQVELNEQNGKTRSLEIKGDEWQLDARILKWNGFATLVGLDTVYRMERITGRYRDIKLERSSSRTVYDLSVESGLDIWHLSRQYNSWIPWIDSVYGSATYLPMSDGANYHISISATGLIARPGNEVAKEIVKNWK